MATPGTYYIDTNSFSTAMSVYTDAALTTCAADGFYQVGRISRQQVNCVLLPPEACPSPCTPEPTPVAPLPTNNAYKVIKVSDQTVGHVVLDTAFSVDEKITTDIDSSGICWLIDSLAVNATTSVITGACNVTPTPPTVYYSLSICPGVAPNSAKPQLFTSLPPNVTSLNQRYYDPTFDVFYIYDNSPGTITPTQGLVSNDLEVITSAFDCPALPTQYNYWNAQECDDPNNTIIFQAPLTQAFVSGTTAIKISGSNICYTVLTGTNTVDDSNVFATDETNCETCNPTPPEPNGFIVSRTGVPDNKVQNNVSSPRSEGDTAITSIDSECWTLGAPIVTATANSIVSECPTIVPCTTYVLKANTNQNATFTYTRCDGTSITVIVLNTNRTEVCAKTDTVVQADPAIGNFSAGTSCNQAQLSQPYDFYTAVACFGPLTGVPITIIRVPTGRVITANQTSVKLNNTCLLITGTSNTEVVGNDPTDIFPNCSTCVGTLCCSAFVTFNNNTSCDTTSPAGWIQYTGTTEESRLDLAVYLYTDAASWIAQNTNYADPGWYTQVNGVGVLPSGVPISRYWDGVKFTESISCLPLQNLTATLIGPGGTSGIDNQITGGNRQEAYNLLGDKSGDVKDFQTGDAVLFSTTVEIIPPYVGVNINVANFQIAAPPGIQDNVTGVTVITGQVSIPTPAGTYYMTFQSCNGIFYYVQNASVLTVNSLFLISMKVKAFNGVICATLISQTQTKPAGWVLTEGMTGVFSSVNNCNNSSCSEANNQGL